MAFEMYAGELRGEVASHEERIFVEISSRAQDYPELSKIWTQFYSSPKLLPEQSERIVHELIDFMSDPIHSTDSDIQRVVLRLLPFFSKAYRLNTIVRCASD